MRGTSTTSTSMETPPFPLSAMDNTAPVAKAILLAESDGTVATIIKSRLGREGFALKHVTEGLATLEAAQGGGYSMCILDTKISGMDGLALLEKMRNHPATSHLPVLLITSLGKEKEIAHGFQLGAEDYLVKPFSPLDLIARVRNILRKTQ